jgi:hypothetical protein
MADEEQQFEGEAGETYDEEGYEGEGMEGAEGEEHGDKELDVSSRSAEFFALLCLHLEVCLCACDRALSGNSNDGFLFCRPNRAAPMLLSFQHVQLTVNKMAQKNKSKNKKKNTTVVPLGAREHKEEVEGDGGGSSKAKRSAGELGTQPSCYPIPLP